MNRRRKGSNAPKPSTQPKSIPLAPSPPVAPAAAAPSRISPPPKVSTPPQNIPSLYKPLPQSKLPSTAARPSVSPPKTPAANAIPPAPQAQNQKTALPSAPPRGAPAPTQRRVITRSDRVRAEWQEFERQWVAPQQAEVTTQLNDLIRIAEQTSRVKGSAFDRERNRIVNDVRRDFVMNARVEWEARLDKVGLMAEDWMDMTPDEMAAVEQVLMCEEDIDPISAPTPPAAAPAAIPVSATLSGRTVVETEQAPLNAAKAFAARAAQVAQSAASQKGKATAHSPSGSSAWSHGPHHVTVMDVPEEPAKPTSAWASKPDDPILEEIGASLKTRRTPSPPSPLSRLAASAQQSVSSPAIPILTTSHGLLTYPVPIFLGMVPLSSGAAADATLTKKIDDLYASSIRQFHEKAGQADVELARQLRRTMPAGDREFTIRAHTVLMEQTARDIVERRDKFIAEELRKRGWGDDHKRGGDPTPMPSKAPVAPQPPGAFPFDDGVRVTAVPAAESEHGWDLALDAEPEVEREPESDVDEVIDTSRKGKAAKKKAKKAAANGRSTPAPPTKVAAPVPKAASVAAEKKAAPAPTPASASSAWGAGARLAAATAARAASPAPISINTKVAPTPIGAKAASAAGSSKVAQPPTTIGRGTPLPPGMSPWEAAQAAKAAKAASGNTTQEATSAKPPSPPTVPVKPPSPTNVPVNGMWTPPPPIETRRSSSRNPYAPTRPSRLGHAAEPPSPEPPSPPPTREPTGQDYVTWFAGSSSEDESAEGRLSEDEEDEDDDRSTPQHAGGMGALFNALAGASPFAMFGAGAGGQPQKERGRATPTPTRIAAARFGAEPAPSSSHGPPEWARWGAAPSHGFGTSPPAFSGFSTSPPGGFGLASSPPDFGGFGGPSAPRSGWGAPQGAGEDDDMLAAAAKALGRGGRGGDNVEEMMAQYVNSRQREKAATPVGGGRVPASAWRR